MKPNGRARWTAHGMMLGAVLSIGLGARPALAEPSAEDKAGARAAAEHGGAEFKAGHYKEALDLFLRAESLIHAPTHVLMIARTQAAVGDVVLAKESYLKITREELASSAPPAFKRAQADAEKELKDLEPHIPSIKVTVQGAAAPKRLIVLMDDKPVPAALVGIPRPVNPGKHAFKATAVGFAAPEKTLIVKEGEALAVVLNLQPAATSAGADAEPAPGSIGAPGSGEQATPPRGGRGRYIGVGLMGVGVVGLVVGGVFTGLYASKRGEANTAFDKCGAGCNGAPANVVRALDEDANGKGTLGAIGLIAGGALAIGGAVLFVVSKPKAPPPPATARVEPWIGFGSAGVSGSF